MKYETVIFDFDGTLLFTLRDLANATNYALERHGYPTRTEREIQGFVGNGVELLVARALPLGFDTPDFKDVMADFRAYYSVHCGDTTAPYPGIMPMLEALKAQGRRMAIATNKYQAAAEELRKQFFGDTVPVIMGDMEGRQRKPAPDTVFAALEVLGSIPEKSVYVGDTEVDMQTAKNSGMDFVCAGWGYRTREQLDELGIELIASTPEELLELI